MPTTDIPLLTRIDGVPLDGDDLSVSLERWLSNLADTINENLLVIEGVLLSLDERITMLGG